jgi:hypothetical protein
VSTICFGCKRNKFMSKTLFNVFENSNKTKSWTISFNYFFQNISTLLATYAHAFLVQLLTSLIAFLILSYNPIYWWDKNTMLSDRYISTLIRKHRSLSLMLIFGQALSVEEFIYKTLLRLFFNIIFPRLLRRRRNCVLISFRVPCW